MSIIGRPVPFNVPHVEHERFKTTTALMEFVRDHYFNGLVPGEVIFVITRFFHNERVGSTSDDRREDRIHEGLYLGILRAKDPLVTVKKDSFLIMDDFLVQTTRHFHSDRGYATPGVQEGSINLRSMDIATFGDNIDKPFSAWCGHMGGGILTRSFVRDKDYKPIDLYPFEVVVGHEAIQKHCAKNEHYKDFYLRACSDLELTPTLTAELAEREELRRVECIYEMVALLEQLASSEERAKWIMSAVAPAAVHVKGGSFAVLENRGDAFVLSLKERLRGSRLLQDLERCVEKAPGFGIFEKSKERILHPTTPGAEIVIGAFFTAIRKAVGKKMKH